MGTAQVSSASGLDKQSVTMSLQRWYLRNYGTTACVPCLPWRRVRCRILILINGSRGDVQPMISLARRLQQLGHRVCMLTNADLVDFCKSHGTDTRAVFPDAHAVILKLGGMVGEYVQMARLAKKSWRRMDACESWNLLGRVWCDRRVQTRYANIFIRIIRPRDTL